MQAALLAGRFTAGKAYRYERSSGPTTAANRGLLEIEAEQAEIVRRIHREFAAGRSARDIIKRLNAEGAPPTTAGGTSPMSGAIPRGTSGSPTVHSIEVD